MDIMIVSSAAKLYRLFKKTSITGRNKIPSKIISRMGVILLLSLFFAALPLHSVRASDRIITSKEQLNDENVRIGVGEGGYAEQVVEKELPRAQRVYLSNNDGYQAVSQGKVDAFIFERPALELAVKGGLSGVEILDENMDETIRIAVGISPKSSIEDLERKLNTFIRELKKDGTLDDMYDRWVIKKDEVLPDIALPENPVYHITVGTTGIVPPFTYYKDSRLCGYDIELAYRFAAWLNADLDFKVFDYSGVVAAAASGDVDCVMAELNVTPEREESLIFSETLIEEPIGIMVHSEDTKVPELKTCEDLSGKCVSMLTGAPFEGLVRSKAPDVGEFTFFNNISDMLLALQSGKTDAVLNNNAVAQLAVNRNEDLVLFPENLDDGTFGFAFAKGDPERDRWQEAFDSIPRDDIQAAWEKWTGADESRKVLQDQDWAGSNGTVTVAACDTLEPMSYAGENGEIKGFDIELILMMAKILDVHVEFTGMEFSAVLSYVQSGKALIGTGSIIITDERSESVDFIGYYPAAFVLIVRTSSEVERNVTFFDSLKQSFEKNFIREDRWKMFIRGTLTTILITLLSVIFGIMLGFGLFFSCRDGNPAAGAITGAALRLIQGMPMVVLLMILYYIIFGNINISGVVVSVIAFTLTFGIAVYGLLKVGVGAVDKGQYEAAYALGYSKNRTFFRIILPQAVSHVMDPFRGEVVALIKSTSIVGYIAVQDLTKIGDIVRSRTYEAFFPLIAIAVIYFALEWMFGLLVSRISVWIDIRKSKKMALLKGVKLRDQD